MNVITRIAPSPTGIMHVGTAYAALFNYAYAKKHNGKFILRIEDTDTKRNVPDAHKAIIAGLKWLGISSGEDPIFQSDRLSIYQKYAQQLLAEDKAYEDDGGIILKTPKGNVSWEDKIRGKVEFPEDQIKDFAIQKKDGYPTYNFAVVVDDSEMGITHVIRAEDHISNTPRQILGYRALGKNIPEFAHFPLLRNQDKSKMSKRKNPVAISWFKEEGFLPEALINFLCLLGWSHPEQKEIFSLTEFVENFSLERVKKSAPVFDIKKLEWMNGQYIKNMSEEKFISTITDWLDTDKYNKLLSEIAPLVKERMRKLSDFKNLANFYLESPDLDMNLFDDNYKSHLSNAAVALENSNTWDAEGIGEVLMAKVNENSFHTGKFFMNLRIAITGNKVSPPLNESLVILGKEETIKRLKSAQNAKKKEKN